ncbi:LytR/AlgR family response regulator transcription factor [Saccharicrinis sp. FJH54]|uniref:LytR/AlgR family response regulator transcription factor n=1 Tax=Saccharicrinis sp. FJH54 TaxID=3344665 RepID=UPI0035D4C2CE
MNRILIVEDEKPAANRISTLLREIDPDAEIAGFTDSVSGTIQWLNQHPHPDLILLDIQLGDGLSFDIFRTIETDSFIIFTTAYDEYALKAFQLNSVDYLLKPVKKADLAAAYEKFMRFKGTPQIFKVEEIVNFIEKQKSSFKSRFIINIGNKLVTVETKQIACFHTLEKNTFLTTFEGKNYPVDFSLDNIEKMVNPDLYFRINRQTLLHFDAIKTIHVMSKSRIKLDLNIELDSDTYVSFAKSPEFRKWLDR